MLRAALYARVSTEMQEKEETIGSQLAAVVRHAEHQGFHTTTALTYTDEGYSGSYLDRPALDELRDHAREGRFDVVVVLCPDRLARKYAYQVLLMEELTRMGVEVHFCERPITDSPDDQLLLQIQGAIAEYERAKIAERSRRGRLHRARMGELSPGRLPYGYRRNAKRYGGDGQILIDDEEASMVRQQLVQRRIQENRHLAKRRLKYEGVYLLRGLLKCGVCAGAYVGSGKASPRNAGGEHIYHSTSAASGRIRSPTAFGAAVPMIDFEPPASTRRSGPPFAICFSTPTRSPKS